MTDKYAIFEKDVTSDRCEKFEKCIQCLRRVAEIEKMKNI